MSHENPHIESSESAKEREKIEALSLISSYLRQSIIAFKELSKKSAVLAAAAEGEKEKMVSALDELQGGNPHDAINIVREELKLNKTPDVEREIFLETPHAVIIGGLSYAIRVLLTEHGHKEHEHKEHDESKEHGHKEHEHKEHESKEHGHKEHGHDKK